jgi:hypothetical protein
LNKADHLAGEDYVCRTVLPSCHGSIRLILRPARAYPHTDNTKEKE